jgi:hypothetical protein
MRASFGIPSLLGLFVIAACSPEVRNFGTGGGNTGGSTTSSTGSAPDSSTSTGTVSKGPKLVKSVPANGDGQAGLDPFFLLYFDRPMSYSDATGKISVSSDQVPTPTYAQVGPCPDGDATCVAGVFPMAFLDPSNTNGGRLPGGIKHTITIDKSYKDPNGNALDADIAVTFTTFKYQNNFYDDSATLAQEVGGIDYDPSSQALFLCGLDSSNQTLYVRRIPLSGGVAGTATTFHKPDVVNTGGPYCYGLDIYDKTLLVSHTYGDRGLVYNALDQSFAPNGPSQILGPTTGLAAPDDGLHNIHSMVTYTPPGVGPIFLVAPGYYLGYPQSSGLFGFIAGQWSIVLPSTGNFDASQGFTIARGVDSQGVHIYLAAQNKIYKYRLSDQMLENTHTLTDQVYDPQLRTDSQGRLYVGDDNDGITVFDTSGQSGFKQLAKRGGLRSGRFGIVESGTNVDVYYIGFRSKGIIGTTRITF